jgi:DNA-binding transcriptional LysR family regulator
MLRQGPVNISTDILEIYFALCEHRNFSAAAAALQKSQSNVSTRVAQLEADVGLKLFDRSKRPLRITRAGMVFLQFAKEFNNKKRDLDRMLKELAVGTAGEVRIGATNSIASYLLPNILAQILSTRPGITISIITDIAPRLFEFVRQGDVDFAIVLSDAIPRDLIRRDLTDAVLCFVVSPDHPLSSRRVIGIEQLQTARFVAGLSGTGHATMVQRVLNEIGILNYNIAVRIGTYEGVKRLVCEGFGISILPEFTIQEEIKQKRLRRIKVNGPTKTKILLVQHPSRVQTSAVSAVENFIETSIPPGKL